MNSMKFIAESVGYHVIDIVKKIKKRKNPLEVSLVIEMYTLDDDYDVSIAVRLIKKESQKSIGEKMFGVKE